MMEPWELAAKEGKTIIARAIGPMIAVYYPYRKSGDLYVVGPGSPDKSITHCCREKCDIDFPTKDFLAHVMMHNKARRKFPGFIIDPGLVSPAERLT